MKKYKILIIFIAIIKLFILNDTITNAEEFGIEKEEAKIIISKLLRLYPEGLSNKDYVNELQKWIDIVEKYNSIENLSEDELKIYLFVIFVAEKSYATHSREILSKNVVNKFEQNYELFLTTMKKHSFLIETTCKMIQRHYILYDKIENTHLFSKKYNDLFVEYLGDKRGKTCIESIIVDLKEK